MQTVIPSQLPVKLLKGQVNFQFDSFCMTLCTEILDDTANTKADLNTKELSGGNYVAKNLTQVTGTPKAHGNIGIVEFQDITWENIYVGGNGATVKSAVILKGDASSLTETSDIIVIFNLYSPINVPGSASNQNLNIVFNTQGVLRLFPSYGIEVGVI